MVNGSRHDEHVMKPHTCFEDLGGSAIDRTFVKRILRFDPARSPEPPEEASFKSGLTPIIIVDRT
jgi:hypothetical protein